MFPRDASRESRYRAINLRLFIYARFAHDALQPASVHSRPLLIIVIAPRRRPFLSGDYSVRSIAPLRCHRTKESRREIIIPKSVSSRFSARTNDRAIGEPGFFFSLGCIFLGTSGCDVHRAAITTHRATTSGPSSANWYHLPRSTVARNRSIATTHTRIRTKLPPGRDNHVILGRVSEQNIRVEHNRRLFNRT